MLGFEGMDPQLAMQFSAQVLAMALALQYLEEWRIANTSNADWIWGESNSLGSWQKWLFLVFTGVLVFLVAYPFSPLWMGVFFFHLWRLYSAGGGWLRGSESLALWLLCSATVAACLGANSLPAKAMFLYVGVQTGLSYFLAGLHKMKEPMWLQSKAIQLWLKDSPVQLPTWLSAGAIRFRHPLHLGVIAAEVGIAIVVFYPRILAAYLILALLFHWLLAEILGLRRFLWIWISAFPALIYLSSLLAQQSLLGGM